MNDFNLFLSSISEKTGISFSVYEQTGGLVYGIDNVSEVPYDFDGVMIDTAKNLTFFNLKFKGGKYVCVLFGAGEAQKNYALLIAELAENAFVKDVELTREEFMHSLLFGDINYAQSAKYVKKFGLSDISAFAMVVSVKAKSNADVKNILNIYMADDAGEVVSVDETQIALVKFVDEEIEAYQSTTEYAEFLVRSVYEETGARITISIGGTVKSIAGLGLSYAQALTAFRISASGNGKGAVHSFKEFMLVKMLEDMPKYKVNEYLDTLMDNNAKEIFADLEMINTAEEFLENSLNVSETSRKLYLHRNTLAYRLDKIEKATGLNIRKFSDAVTFRLITILYKLSR